MTATANRVARVTVEGHAHVVKGTLVRLVYGPSSFIVDTTDPTVSVEYIDPPRTWAEGDVVQDSGLVAFWRGQQLWHGVLPAGASVYMTDAEVDAAGYTPLRYQAGE